MPKFIVTRDSYFQPFDYTELVRPVAHMQEVHNATQDAYDQLNLESGALSRYISDNPDDSEARALYDSYMNNLNKLQDNLWKHGVNAQTRRDLSIARAGYASDITRLSSAIKARQERSKAYWDMKHAHPDMVMGADPGLSGLDNYLKDDLYGQNYYSYSGNAFTNEVGADAKARASELLRMPQYQQNPQAQGYLTRILQEGYTSVEVQNASNAVRRALASGNKDEINNLPLGEQILANVLISHIDSTGASGKVSPEEFDRLINYGQEGLSQAIGRTTVQDMSDKVWDYNRQVALANMKSGGKSSGRGGSGSGDDVQSNNRRGYTINALVEQLTSPGYETLAKSTKGKYKKFADGPVMIAKPDGTSVSVESPFEMSRIIYNPESRKEARQVFNGLDIANLKNGQTIDKIGDDGKTYTYTVKKLTAAEAARAGVPEGSFGLIQSNGDVNMAGTKKLNGYVNQYDSHVKKYMEANKDIDFKRYAVTPSEEYKERENRGWAGNIDSDDYESLLMTSETQGDYTAATLADSSTYLDAYRNNLARAIVNTYNKARTNSGDKIGKGDRFAFYKVGKGGTVSAEKGETDLKKVFGSKNNKTVDIDGSLSEVIFTPENIAEGVGQGRPSVRFTTNVNGDTWQTDAAMLGNPVYNALKSASIPGFNWSPQMQQYLGVRCPTGSGGAWSNCDAVYYMMEPILNPAEALSMSPEQKMLWTQIAYTLLNGEDELGLSDINGPIINMPDGSFRLAMPDDIVRNPTLQADLRSAVVGYVNDVLSVPREAVTQKHMQSIGNNSEKAETYLP